MTTLRNAAQQALEALEWHLARGAYGADIEGVTGNLRAALAQAEPVQSAAWVDAYDMIDRFLRNNLRDDDYAEYSAALDSLYTAPQQAEPVESAQKSGEFRVMVCGVDCHPGDQHCNGYCTGKTDDPPEATAEQQAEPVQRKPARWTEL